MIPDPQVGDEVYSRRFHAFGVVTAVEPSSVKGFERRIVDCGRRGVMSIGPVDLERVVTLKLPWDEARELANHPAARNNGGIYGVTYATRVTQAVDRLKKACLKEKNKHG